MDQQEIDIGSTVDAIASDLGLGGSETPADETPAAEEVSASNETDSSLEERDESAAAQEDAPAADATPKQDAAPVARSAPKSWAKEKHDLWGKLPPEAQEQIEHREKQMLEGLSQYSEGAKFAKAINDATADYMPLIKAQGLDLPQATRFLLEAHKQLSQGSDEQRTAYLVKVAKSYGLDLGKAAALAPAGAQDETPAVKDLRERQERIERDLGQRSAAEQKAQREHVASTVTSFAEAKDDKGALKHPYFDECAEDIVALINAGHPLEKAYEKAVFANPVTRAKELARLSTENEEALRAKAKKEADAARNATRPNANSRDTKRAPTASKANSWEETLGTTLKEIQSRTH